MRICQYIYLSSYIYSQYETHIPLVEVPVHLLSHSSLITSMSLAMNSTIALAVVMFLLSERGVYQERYENEGVGICFGLVLVLRLRITNEMYV